MNLMRTWALAAPAAIVPQGAVSAETHYGPGMMWGGGWFHMIFGSLMMIIVVAAIVLLVVLGLRWLSSSGHGLPGQTRARTPLDILEERLAKGEIDVAEFEERRRALAAGTK